MMEESELNRAPHNMSLFSLFSVTNYIRQKEE